MYLAWLGETSTRSEVAEVMLGRVGEELLALDPLRLTIDVWDPESDIPAPVPTPEGETPLHGLVSLWVDAVDQREPFEQVLECGRGPHRGLLRRGVPLPGLRGQPVVGAAPWPDGPRSPGVLTVALLQQHPEQTFDQWITRWHTRISPITEAIQPRSRYVRNAVFRPVTEGAPPMPGSWRRRGRPWSTSPIRCCSFVATETPSACRRNSPR